MIDLLAVESRRGPRRIVLWAEGDSVDHVAFRLGPTDGLAGLHKRGIICELRMRYGAGGDGRSIYVEDAQEDGVEPNVSTTAE